MKSINDLSRKVISQSLTLLLVIITIGCMKQQKEPPKSMEQLRKQNGVPVRVEAMSKVAFSKSLSFYATLKGIKESIRGSSLGDRVLKINAKVGEDVKEGQIIVEFPSDIPNLRYKQTKIGLETIEKTYNRMKNLLTAGEISQQQFDEVETQFLVNKENFDALNRALFVESPIDGTITDIFVNEDDIIVSDMPGKPTPLFKVAQLDRMVAKVWITEDEIGNIKSGGKVSTNVNGTTIYGKVTDIALSLDKSNQAFGVEIIFPNPKRILKSGTTIDIKLRTYNNPEVITVRRNLIISEGGKNYVYISVNGKAIKRQVVTGNSSGMNIEIIDGLSQGDMLITEGSALVEDGTKINVVD